MSGPLEKREREPRADNDAEVAAPAAVPQAVPCEPASPSLFSSGDAHQADGDASVLALSTSSRVEDIPVLPGWTSLVSESDMRRFLSYIRVSAAGCWIWTGYINPDGYGQGFYNGRYGHRAHRFAYIACVGPIPEGLTIDHLCGVKPCANPAHLEAVTMRENILRSAGLSAENARKTHCIHGHAFDEANTYLSRDGRRRQCRTCTAIRETKRQRKVAA